MNIALKLMGEVIDDVLGEAEKAGEPEPNDYEIWTRAGMRYRGDWETRVVYYLRRRWTTR